MRQVLFHIPLKPFAWLPAWWPDYVPVYGYGVMLALTLLVCTWMAGHRARKEGIAPQYIQDLAVWIFLGGLIGARTVYMIQYGEPLSRFFLIWQGGLVFYGSAIGGVAGYALAYWFRIRKDGISTWQLADIIAPAAAVGLCLGRIGCFLNGCCYGHVACSECPAVSFPFCSPARMALVRDGYQTPAGFTLADLGGPPTVGSVEAGSPAQEAGLRTNDVITAVDGRSVHSYLDLRESVLDEWPRGKNDLALTVQRNGRILELPSFSPHTLGLHPTQLYESISMVFLFLLLTAFYPFRRRTGQVMVLFIFGYSIHRFLNEMLRNDTEKLADGLTLSQNGSVFFFSLAIVLAIWLWMHPEARRPSAA
jgi:phosphatidylglycerol:prolipoprotein diacylglycerol transferase